MNRQRRAHKQTASSVGQSGTIPALKATYRRFMAETNPEQKDEAGKNLIRAIFGKDAIAEGPIL